MEKLNADVLQKMFLKSASLIIKKEPYLTEIDSVIGDGDHGVVEGGTNMNLTTFDVLLFATTADNLLTGFSIICCHILFSLLTSSCSQWSSWDPCGYERWSCCADRERAGRGDDGCRDSSRSRSDA